MTLLVKEKLALSTHLDWIKEASTATDEISVCFEPQKLSLFNQPR